MIYGKSYQQARLKRLKFAGHRCEVCKRKERLECHHPQSEEFNAYELDEQGTLTMADVVILCVSCHDAITNRDRAARFASKEVWDVPSPHCVLPKRKRPHVNDYDQTNWDIPAADAQQPVRRPIKQV